MTPFLILALPRSRTAWLSQFLTHGGVFCGHDQMRYMRGIADARAWLAQDSTGTVETAAARWWRLLVHLRPDLRIVTIRRPVAECVDSLMRLDMRGVCAFDRAVLERQLRRYDRALNRLEDRVSEVLSVSYADLDMASGCARVWRHVMPTEFDAAWWQRCAPVNIQIDMPAMMRYAIANGGLMQTAAKVARGQMRAVMGVRRAAPRRVYPDGTVIQEERMATFWDEAQELFRAHCRAVGEPEDQYTRKNLAMMERMELVGSWQWMTARQHGRMVGYLATLVSPSMEDAGVIAGTQTLFYAEPGSQVGLRLQRAAIEAMRDRGVGEIYMRAGVRGEGPRLGVLYRRLGAEDFGHIYKLTVKAA